MSKFTTQKPLAWLGIVAIALACSACNAQETVQGDADHNPPGQSILRMAQTQDNQPTAQSNSIDQNTIDEINQIRKQLGGGIAKELSGLQFESPLGGSKPMDAEAAFTEEMNKLANEIDGKSKAQAPASNREPSPPRIRPIIEVPSAGAPTYAPVPNPYQPSLVQAPRGTPPSYQHHSTNANPASSLRSAARQLELSASQLEHSGLYQEADSLRQTAREFWLKARQFAPDRNSANRIPGPLPSGVPILPQSSAQAPIIPNPQYPSY